VAGFRWFLPLAIMVHLAANAGAGLYGPVWQQASIREAQRLLLAGAAAGALLVTVLIVLPRPVPLSVAVIGCSIAVGFFGLLRFHSRLFAFHRGQRPEGRRALIVGAGESAGSLLRELARDEVGELRPVALVDDDPRKLGRRLAGIPIVGTIDDLEQVGRELDVDLVLLAIPSADSALVRRGCSSPGPAGRSAPRSPDRCSPASPSGWCCSTTTRPTCTTSPASSRLMRGPGAGRHPQPRQIRSIFAEHRPTVVFHAAATSTSRCWRRTRPKP
jgi:hypothetical protein